MKKKKKNMTAAERRKQKRKITKKHKAHEAGQSAALRKFTKRRNLATEEYIIGRLAKRLSFAPDSEDRTLALLFNEYADMAPHNLARIHEYRLEWELLHGKTKADIAYITDWPDDAGEKLFRENIQAWVNQLPGFLAGYYNESVRADVKQEELLGDTITFGANKHKESSFWQRLEKLYHKNCGTLHPDLEL